MDRCHGCRYHDDFTAVCVNADSEHCADFRHSGCEFYKPEADNEWKSNNSGTGRNDQGNP